MTNFEMTSLNEEIRRLIDEKDIRNLKIYLQDVDEMEILYIMDALSRKEKALVFRLLSKDLALSVFEQLGIALQRDLLEGFTDEFAREVIEELTPDDRVELLEELPASVAKRLIAALSPEDRKVTNLLMGYEAETAGRIMTPEFITLRPEMTVEEALAKIRRQAKDKETIYTLYVTDEGKKLLGVLTLKNLIVAEPKEKVADIMSDTIIKVSTDTDRETAARNLKTFDLLALPVVDKEERIVGIITIDDAVDILEEEATEDIFDQAGLANITGGESNRSEVLVNGSIWAIWKVRLPFLLLTLVFGIGSGFIISFFEEALSVVAVAFFIPVIMDMGGNVGSQSSTIYVRGSALGHIQTNNFRKHFVKEITVGLSLGLIVGVLGWAIVWGWQSFGEYSEQAAMLALSVGLSLLITMTLAAILGFFIPWILVKLNVDQAAGSAPIITSLKDVLGLAIYFGLVSLLVSALVEYPYHSAINSLPA